MSDQPDNAETPIEEREEINGNVAPETSQREMPDDDACPSEPPAENAAEHIDADLDFRHEPVTAEENDDNQEPGQSIPRHVETAVDDASDNPPGEETQEPKTSIPTEMLIKTLEKALEAPNLEVYRDFIKTHENESGHDIDTIAAALAASIGNQYLKRNRPQPQRDNHLHPGERRRPEVGMAQYRIEVGRSDGVQPRNIVGALTNEAELGATDIGYIKIFDRFSLVELPEDVPRDELEHLAEIWVCGRKMGIHLDDGPPENDGGKSRFPRRDKRPQGRGGPRSHGRSRQPASRGGYANPGGQRGRPGGHKRGEGQNAYAGGGGRHDDDFGNRIDYTPKDRGRLHNIIYGDGIANVGQDGPGGGHPNKGRRNPGGGGFKGNRGGGGNGNGNGGPPRRRRRQD